MIEDKRPTRRVTLNMDQHTFELLEAVVVGIASEDNEDDPEKYTARLDKMHSKSKDDFGPGVAELLNDIANTISAGVFRGGCWERSYLDGLTSWQGTYIPAMLGPLAKADCEHYRDLYKSIEKKNDNE